LPCWRAPPPSIRPGPAALLLALVLFLWTPPHFWSLAIANRADYAQAGVPMLPVVVGPERAARTVLLSTIALFLASLAPLAFGAGWVYGAGALVGACTSCASPGSWRASPSAPRPWVRFLPRLVQLSLLLVAASIDALMR
jgi:protoheme IX farnesyltransferase